MEKEVIEAKNPIDLVEKMYKYTDLGYETDFKYIHNSKTGYFLEFWKEKGENNG